MQTQTHTLIEPTMSNDSTEELMKRIKPLMDSVDISTDCNPNMLGAINSVVASGGSPTEEAIKLMILKDRGEIDMDQYLKIMTVFAEETAEKRQSH